MPHTWDPIECLATGSAILNFIRDSITHAPATRSFQAALNACPSLAHGIPLSFAAGRYFVSHLILQSRRCRCRSCRLSSSKRKFSKGNSKSSGWDSCWSRGSQGLKRENVSGKREQPHANPFRRGGPVLRSISSADLGTKCTLCEDIPCQLQSNYFIQTVLSNAAYISPFRFLLSHIYGSCVPS